MQLELFEDSRRRHAEPFKQQLLKWIGNKQRFAHEIISYFPHRFGTYFEPFLGSGAVLATLSPKQAVASDVFRPLVEIWQCLHEDPDQLIEWYSSRWREYMDGERVEQYERIKSRYNSNPSGADLVFLCRSCYGGVVRFRKADGYMSTPCGVHKPISPDSFCRRVWDWNQRTAGSRFLLSDFRDVMAMAKPGDMVYCDPPYTHTQAILYGAQDFSLGDLLEQIRKCKDRGVFVALSIDGTKKSGSHICDFPVVEGLFEREAFVNCGRSMLRRFQMNGETLEGEVVADRLLLTF